MVKDGSTEAFVEVTLSSKKVIVALQADFGQNYGC
ncbi:hypothetical protein MED121_24005 [Marinomonas sp. MED121]|nr:hypothetical protein MED121_24005 [Marinomonas sp. MED121]